ncbi:excisionase family DNA-binding protein [Micromonospora saelicesensis]|uniref:excisionase family DNA-binding protein n=1 Tax=Micromonospora saelicesensis TaxID=285676 RepID=UPI003D9090A5
MTAPIVPKWHSPAEVAAILGYGLSEVKMKIVTGELRSVKDGEYRRILPEWIDEYIQTEFERQDAA